VRRAQALSKERIVGRAEDERRARERRNARARERRAAVRRADAKLKKRSSAVFILETVVQSLREGNCHVAVGAWTERGIEEIEAGARFLRASTRDATEERLRDAVVRAAMKTARLTDAELDAVIMELGNMLDNTELSDPGPYHPRHHAAKRALKKLGAEQAEREKRADIKEMANGQP
jgi:hypothetical protein